MKRQNNMHCDIIFEYFTKMVNYWGLICTLLHPNSKWGKLTSDKYSWVIRKILIHLNVIIPYIIINFTNADTHLYMCTCKRGNDTDTKEFHYISILFTAIFMVGCVRKRNFKYSPEREIKFIGLFGDRGHRGPYSPFKPCNHNLYIGLIIFPHIDNPQSTGYK